jgi:hypothetical protein
VLPARGFGGDGAFRPSEPKKGISKWPKPGAELESPQAQTGNFLDLTGNNFRGTGKLTSSRGTLSEEAFRLAGVIAFGQEAVFAKSGMGGAKFLGLLV